MGDKWCMDEKVFYDYCYYSVYGRSGQKSWFHLGLSLGNWLAVSELAPLCNQIQDVWFLDILSKILWLQKIQRCPAFYGHFFTLKTDDENLRVVFLFISQKTVNDRVKIQARSQTYWSRALRWGIIHFCTLNTFGDTTKFMKIWDFQSLRFCKRMAKSLYRIAKKCENPKIGIFYS